MQKSLDYITSSQKTHIIFDFDKTLFKLVLDWDKYFDNIKEELIVTDAKLYRSYCIGNLNWSEMQNLYIKKYGDKLRKLICKNNIKAETQLFENAIENKSLINRIETIDDEYNLYIWSSNVEELIKKILNEHKILRKFKRVIARNHVSFLKPNPEGFYLIYNPKIPLTSYLFVGNSISDKRASEVANIDYFQVTYFID